MRKSFSKFGFNILIVIPLLFLGCKKDTKHVHVSKSEPKSTVQVPDISGLRFGYLKNVTVRGEGYFASIVFIENRIKRNGQRRESVTIFADSLEVLEFPNEYFISVKGKEPEQFLIDSSAAIIMQTLNRDASGNYKFNENVDRIKLCKLFASSGAKRFSHIPFKFTLKHNNIISIEEKYIP